MSTLKTFAIAFGATVAVGTVATIGAVTVMLNDEDFRIASIKKLNRLREQNNKENALNEILRNAVDARITTALTNQATMSTFKANKYLVLEVSRISAMIEDK